MRFHFCRPTQLLSSLGTPRRVLARNDLLTRRSERNVSLGRLKKRDPQQPRRTTTRTATQLTRNRLSPRSHTGNEGARARSLSSQSAPAVASHSHIGDVAVTLPAFRAGSRRAL